MKRIKNSVLALNVGSLHNIREAVMPMYQGDVYQGDGEFDTFSYLKN